MDEGGSCEVTGKNQKNKRWQLRGRGLKLGIKPRKKSKTNATVSAIFCPLVYDVGELASLQRIFELSTRNGVFPFNARHSSPSFWRPPS